MPLREAVRTLHLPHSNENFDDLVAGLSPAHKRLIYDEFFFFSLILSLQRREFTEKAGISFEKPKNSWLKLKENLSFQFTGAQKRVLKEILQDMEKPQSMYRLLQGDVGAGKTVVAAAVSLIALESSYQVAVMAPTEVLVEQHFEKFSKWFEGMPFDCLKLTGSMRTQERKLVLEALKDSKPKIVFGTHALFEDKVQFFKLGLVIVDEQHRFGVRQRARLIAKGHHPDVLVMTATPIPRSLALTIYGDLDVSILDELPPGRKPVTTRIFSSKNEEVLHSLVKAQLRGGRQAYFVYPLIEESELLDLQSIEKALPRLREIYQDFSLDFLHGRLEASEKTRILENFRLGKTQILVSTTVIEVGVDVPNASVMLIHNADRFGLSQLHQLRGRIGRGSEEAFCFLVSDLMRVPEVKKRLQTMEKISDGFRLSEIDLEIRGPGEFIGTKQSGLPEFQLANLPRDLGILQRARQDAHDVLRQDSSLQKFPLLLSHLKRKFQSFEIS
jgi:ATP-dependent DNA helicase RecG